MSTRSKRAASPHLLVGGKSFHDREEVDTMRAALAAIEWPDDELSVFATLRGALFAIDDGGR
jgi:ATP-dependent exoDNAse (exonuclease V) beta subunit